MCVVRISEVITNFGDFNQLLSIQARQDAMGAKIQPKECGSWIKSPLLRDTWTLHRLYTCIVYDSWMLLLPGWAASRSVAGMPSRRGRRKDTDRQCGSVGVGMKAPHSSSIRDFDWLATKKSVRNCCMTTSAEIHSGPRTLERSAFPDSRCIRRGPSFPLCSARQTESLDPYSLHARREDKYREISER